MVRMVDRLYTTEISMSNIFTIFIRHDLQQHLTCIQKTQFLNPGLVLIFFHRSSLIPMTCGFEGVLGISMARLVSVVSLRELAVRSSSSQSDPVCKTFFFSLRLQSVRLFLHSVPESLLVISHKWMVWLLVIIASLGPSICTLSLPATPWKVSKGTDRHCSPHRSSKCTRDLLELCRQP